MSFKPSAFYDDLFSFDMRIQLISQEPDFNIYSVKMSKRHQKAVANAAFIESLVEITYEFSMWQSYFVDFMQIYAIT